MEAVASNQSNESQEAITDDFGNAIQISLSQDGKLTRVEISGI